MTDLPCDDLSCICCHPEEQHACYGPVAPGIEPCDTWTCPECGVTWTKFVGRPDDWPAGVKWRHEGEWWRADGPVPTKSEIAARGDAS